MSPRLTDPELIKPYWMNGTPITEIATIFGYARSATISSIAKREGWPTRAKGIVNIDRNAEIMRLYKAGQNMAEIARSFRIAKSSVWRVVCEVEEAEARAAASNGRVKAFSASPTAIARALAASEARA